MKAHYRLKSLALIVFGLLVLSAAGCAASRGAYHRGIQAELAKDYDRALVEFKTALDHDPDNIDYRLKFEETRFEAAFWHFQNGRRALEKNDLVVAKQEFQRTVELDPTNDLASAELERIASIEKSREQKQPEPELKYEDMREASRTDPGPQAVLEPKINTPITFRMTQDS